MLWFIEYVIEPAELAHHLNTSYVMVHLWSETELLDMLENLNTSYVMVHLPRTATQSAQGGFKYILCYGSSKICY